jgi:predicted DsbA family dithiol-disulfide isomerase
LSPPLVDIAFDYVDPGSWMVLLRLDAGVPGLVPELDPSEVRWRPLEFRPPEQAPLDPEDAGWKALHDGIRAEAEALGVPFRMAPRVPRTRKAHELAFHARERGRFDAVHRALFRAHFAEGLDLGRVDVLIGIAERAGLDAAEARTVLGVDRFRDAVVEERTALLAAGVRGVPTLWKTREGREVRQGEVQQGEVHEARVEGYHGAQSFAESLESVLGFREHDGGRNADPTTGEM